MPGYGMTPTDMRSIEAIAGSLPARARSYVALAARSGNCIALSAPTPKPSPSHRINRPADVGFYHFAEFKE